MTESQEKLKELHGTPEEFAAKCNKAADSLEMTTEECQKAIEAYQQFWDREGK